MKRILSYIKSAVTKNHFLSENTSATTLRGKVTLQLVVSASFLLLSITNIIEESYVMLVYTLLGFIFNLAFSVISIVLKKEKFCTYSVVIICTIAFAFFVVTGRNDGFAALWIIMMPTFAMAIMDFTIGLISNIFAQIFLVVVFWTPLHTLLPYQYNEQFCIRFPIFFFVSLILGLATTVILQKSQFDAKMRLSELQRVTEVANRLAKYDSLTSLANRRCVYEMFNAEYNDETVPHSIVMGDIDHFKAINDTYGHEFGDEVLVAVSELIMAHLPENYIKSRWGGEEFLIAANEPIDAVYKNIETLRLEIANHVFICNGSAVKVTMTFGIAEYYKSEDLNNTIIMADRRLYFGKETARNSTVRQ